MFSSVKGTGEPLLVLGSENRRGLLLAGRGRNQAQALPQMKRSQGGLFAAVDDDRDDEADDREVRQDGDGAVFGGDADGGGVSVDIGMREVEV
jgi:hypothetical protein